MAVGLPGNSGVVSGMRNQSSVHVYVDVAAVLRAGIALYVNDRLPLRGCWLQLVGRLLFLYHGTRVLRVPWYTCTGGPVMTLAAWIRVDRL